MVNKFTDAIDDRLQSIAGQKTNLYNQLEDLNCTAELLQLQKSQILEQLFYANSENTFIQKVNETHFIEKHENLKIKAQIFATIEKGQYVWEYSVLDSQELCELKTTKFNHVQEIVSLFNLVDDEINTALKLFHLLKNTLNK